MLRWFAEYSDGQKVKDGEVSYVNLDRSKLAVLGLEEDGEPVISVAAETGKAIFYRILSFINVNSNVHFRYWMIGWRSKTEVDFTVIYEDGSQEHYTGFGVKPWINELDWYSFEQLAGE